MSDSDDPRMTIGQHLEILRWHILKCVIYVFVGLLVCLAFQQYLMEWATWPHRKVVADLQREAKVKGAPERIRDLLTEVSVSDRNLEEAIDEAQRLEVGLRERLEPSSDRLTALRLAQKDLEERLTAHEERSRAMAEDDTVDREDVAAIASERVLLAAEAAALRARVETDVHPFMDRFARAPRLELVQLRYQETFLAYLKLALVAGLFLVSPLVARELWMFVAVGLYPKEKRYINLFAPLTFAAFAVGATFGYFVLIPFGLRFLATYAPADMVAGTFSLGDYLSLFTTLTIVVGLVFELPLLMSFTTLIRLTGPDWFRKYRRYMLLGSFIVAAMLTPPDPVTQCLMAVPLIGLYELGIIMSAAIVSRRKDEADDGGGRAEGRTSPAVAPTKADAPKPYKPLTLDSAPEPAPDRPKLKPEPPPHRPKINPTHIPHPPTPKIVPPSAPTFARGSYDPGSGEGEAQDEIPAEGTGEGEANAGKEIPPGIVITPAPQREWKQPDEDMDADGDNDDPTLGDDDRPLTDEDEDKDEDELDPTDEAEVEDPSGNEDGQETP